MISSVVIVALLGLTAAPAVFASPVNLATAVDHVVLPKPRPQCVPATCGLEACAGDTEVCSEVLANCAEGFYCPFNYTESISARTVLPKPRPECVLATCGLAGCADAEVCSEVLANCAEGFDCPYNVTCTPERCNWPVCYNTEACPVQKRQFHCPPGMNCGHGPACVPATCGLALCADADVCSEIIANCAEGFDCPSNVTCTPDRCNWPVCYNTEACPVQKRQFHCPPGMNCGHGPACTESTCHIPACAESAPCLQKPQLPCPPGKQCGHGPECTEFTCNIPGCADSAPCLRKRQLHCPPGIQCGHGPVCTGMDCADPLCADAPSCKKASLEKKDTPLGEPPLSDKYTYWLPSRIPGDPAFKHPAPCPCPSLEICTESGYCVCQSDGLAAAEVPHIPLPPVNLTADSSIPTLFGDGKPTCKHVCNEWAFCICLSGPDCHCGADPDTPTGYELEGKEYHGYHVTQTVSICGQVCTADDFCICKQDSIPGCECSINTSKFSPFVAPAAPGINPFLAPPKNCTLPGEAPPPLNPPPRPRPCADICDQSGHCGCD